MYVLSRGWCRTLSVQRVRGYQLPRQHAQLVLVTVPLMRREANKLVVGFAAPLFHLDCLPWQSLLLARIALLNGGVADESGRRWTISREDEFFCLLGCPVRVGPIHPHPQQSMVNYIQCEYGHEITSCWKLVRSNDIWLPVFKSMMPRNAPKWTGFSPPAP